MMPWTAPSLKKSLSEEQETAVRKAFKKADEGPKILIVTDNSLPATTLPILYCMYLDKPMRNHVLLQAIEPLTGRTRRRAAIQSLWALSSFRGCCGK